MPLPAYLSQETEMWLKKEAENALKYKDLTDRNTAHVECKNKGDTGNNRGDWDYFKVI
jgi:hypothetical protein